MKIGILTYHSVYNFGANLQCYSTVSYLKEKGFEPIVINWIPLDLESKYNKEVSQEQALAHQKFVEDYLPLSIKCRTSKDVANIIKDENIKLVIIGSDAVLQHRTFFDRIKISKKYIRLDEKLSNEIFPNPFWGEFIDFIDEDIPIALMSASSQNINFKIIRGGLKRKIGKMLLRFNVITVRDKWTQKMVEYFTKSKVSPKITPDPVFAFNQNIPEQISKEEILKKYNLPENYILLSFYGKHTISQSWVDEFQALTNEQGKECVFIPTPEGMNPFKNVKTISLPVSPMDWYGLIKYSSAYIGERMHPVIVALHNQVPFFSFDKYGIRKFKYFINTKSSKIYDLLLRAGYLDYYVNVLNRDYKSPEPVYVLNKINDFDHIKNENFVKSMYESYNELMSEITGLI